MSSCGDSSNANACKYQNISSKEYVCILVNDLFNGVEMVAENKLLVVVIIN